MIDPTHQSWTRTTPEGDEVTVTVSPEGIAVSIHRITGAKESYLASLEEYETEWAPWLSEAFDDCVDDVSEAVSTARNAATWADDEIP